MEIKKETKKECSGVKITLEDGTKTIGRCFVYFLFNDQHTEPFALLEDVFVVEEERGKGHATTLTKLAVAEARDRGCYKLICTARDTKPGVQQMYEKFGFTKWGTEFRMDLTVA